MEPADGICIFDSCRHLAHRELASLMIEFDTDFILLAQIAVFLLLHFSRLFDCACTQGTQLAANKPCVLNRYHLKS